MEPGRDEERIALGRQAAAVLGYLERRAPTHVEAVALFRRTMLRAWGRIDRFPAQGVRRQRVWLLAAAARVLAESGADRLEAPAAIDPCWDGRSSDSGHGRAGGHAPTLRAAVPRLGYLQRELVTLVHWDGLTLPEAAEVLGMESGSAVREYSAARANLRAALEGAQI